MNTSFLKSVKTNRLRLRDAIPTLTTVPSNDFAVIQNGRARILTPTECEKLQGFPKDWTSSLDAYTRRCNLIGNAITVPVVEQIGITLKETDILG